MKSIWLFLFAIASLGMHAQQPCVAIETILVDACTLGGGCANAASPTCICEGKNEMLTFRVGDSNLFLSDMIINWPFNPWLGICQDATTAQNVADLNATIESCGELIEPLDGILPAGALVLVVTSSDMCLEANPFTDLSETMYILFQCAGAHQGHFANHGPPGLRTTTITFGGGCLSTVTYDRSLLVTQAGTPGPEDGAAVDFDLNGNATYYNNGCQAPGPVIELSAGGNLTSCAGEPVQLNGMAQGPLSNLTWSGGLGSFSSPNTPVTIYTPALGENGPVTLTLTANDCNGPISASMQLNLIPEPVATITAPQGTNLCEGQTLQLNLPPELTGLWSNGQNGNSITIDEPGVYTVSVSNLCGEDEGSIVIFSSAPPDGQLVSEPPYAICEGQAITVSANSDDTLTWPDGSSGTSFSTDQPGNYVLVISNECGSFEIEFDIIEGGDPPDAGIINLGEDALCPNDFTQLEAQGNGNYTWSDGSTSSVIEVPSGTYTLTVSNACGASEVSYTVAAIPGEPVAILQGAEAALCEEGDSVLLEAIGDGEIIWGDGTEGNFLLVDSIGTYTVTGINECGTFEALINVVNPSVTSFFQPSTPQRGIPVTINFINLSEQAVSYIWFVDSVEVSTNVNFERYFNWPGSYEITLMAIDANGCTDVYTRIIEVALEPDQLFVPNAFTPDNDGINEVFRAYGPSFPDFRMEVYDRWGSLVFASDDPRKGWNGDSHGSGYYAQNEVYAWVITYSTPRGRERLTGHVVLIR